MRKGTGPREWACAEADPSKGGFREAGREGVRLGIECRWSLMGPRNVQLFVKLEVFGPLVYIMESLILAQNERWRRVLSMQVVRQGGATRPRAADW